jgi:coiled-coil domain-containing protein 12
MPESAAARKKRLAAIKKKAKGENDKNETKNVIETQEEEKEEPASKRMKFRNYAPHDSSLAAKEGDSQNEEEKRSQEKRSSSGNTKEEVDIIKVKLQEAEEIEEDVTAPKKPHYDLKAQLEPKLSKLKKRTTRAIVDMLREKLSKGEE